MSIHNIEVCEPKSVNSIYNINSPRARGHLIAKFEHSSGVYHLKEHRLGFQKIKLLSVYVGG